MDLGWSLAEMYASLPEGTLERNCLFLIMWTGVCHKVGDLSTHWQLCPSGKLHAPQNPNSPWEPHRKVGYSPLSRIVCQKSTLNPWDLNIYLKTMGYYYYDDKIQSRTTNMLKKCWEIMGNVENPQLPTNIDCFLVFLVWPIIGVGPKNADDFSI